MYIQIKDPHALKVEIYKQGYSMTGFANRAGIKRNSLYRMFKTGRVSPPNAQRIASALPEDYEKIFLVVSCPKGHD